MDYKYIDNLLERYFNAETTFEEESILRSFFKQEDIPAEMEQWRELFVMDDEAMLGDDFDARILELTGQKQEVADTPVVKAREIKLTNHLRPLFKAAAVIAIVLTIGGALQAPWDNSWSGPATDYASVGVSLDSVAAVSPVQAEIVSDRGLDSTNVMLHVQPTN
jgi:hypothetical protein